MNPLFRLLRRVPGLRPDLDQPPAYCAALIQLVATLSAGAQALWLVEATGHAMTALQWAAMQGCIACVLAILLNSAWWWRPIHLLFAPALIMGLTLQLSPLICLAILLTLVGVYWGSHRNQVPLYLSGEPAWREVAGLLPAQPGTRVIDLGSGLGGLVAFLGRLRPDVKVDGVEAAPLPLLTSRIRKWLHNWHGNLIWGDLWRVDLAAYNVALAYLSPVPMQMLWQKACCEMRPGSLLVSHSFAVPGVAPMQVRQLPGNVRLYVYRVGD